MTTLPPPTLAPSATPVVLVYRDSDGNDPRQFEAAAWSDGRIVWRVDDALYQGHTDPARIASLLGRLHRDGVFGDGSAYYGNVGPDAAFEVIEVRTQDRQLRLESWHEVFEDDPGLVATSHGIEALEGRDRAAVVAVEPKEYQRFRRIWSDIRSSLRSWIPSHGVLFEGEPPSSTGGEERSPTHD